MTQNRKSSLFRGNSDKLLTALGLTILSSALASSNASASPDLTLASAVQSAVASHPQIKAARTNIAAARARLIDAGKLKNPVLELSLTSQIADGPDREGSLFAGFSQAFPITGKLLHQRDLRAADVRLACAEVLEAERNFIAEVQDAYIRAVGSNALVSETKRIEAATEQSIGLARRRLEAAQGSQLDLEAAETEHLLATRDRILAESEYRASLAKLRPYLRLAPGDRLVLTQSLDDVVAELRPTLRNSLPSDWKRSDIAAAELRWDRALTGEELARAEAFEDWEIAAGYESERNIDQPIGVEREHFAGMGLKIPLPMRTFGEGKAAEARAATEKAGHELEAVKSNSLSEVETGIVRVRAAEDACAILETRVLPQLRDREAKTRRAYEEGLADFSQVILLQQQQTRTRRAATRAKLDKALAMASLQHSLGSHPHLQNASTCSLYDCGTEPANPPWSPPVLNTSGAIRATPVAAPAPTSRRPRQLAGAKPKPIVSLLRKLKKPRS